MKRAVLINFNDVITPLYQTFESVPLTDIVEKDKKPDCLVTWTDFTPDLKMICAHALQQGVLTFVVQHGRRAMRDYWMDMAQPTSLATFVWGDLDYRDAIQGNWHPSQVFRVGAPWFAYRPQRKEEKGMVIYDVPHWLNDPKESQKAWKELNRIKGITPVAKLIQPSMQKRENYEGMQCETIRNEPGHIQATYEILSKASAVVCMMDGTLELMAHSLGVPVIHIAGFKQDHLEGTWQGVEDTFSDASMIATELGKIEEAVTKAIEEPLCTREEALKKLHNEAGDPEKDTPVQSMTTIIGELVDRYHATGHVPVTYFDKSAYEEAPRLSE